MQTVPAEKIRAWVEQHFDFKERKEGTELVICNPFDGDTGYHFNISTTKATCHDWRGDTWQGRDQKGKVHKCTFLHFVLLYLNCNYREAAKAVMGESSRFFLPRKPVEDVVPDEPEIYLPAGAIPLPSSPYPKQTDILMRWLASRGVSAEDVKRYNLHHVGSDVVWPYYEYGTLVYWQSRSRLSKQFLFPPLTPGGKGKGDYLYGFDDVEPASHLVLTEAIFDKHALRHQTAATGGAVLTRSQLDLVRALGPRDGVILAPDNDKAGLMSIVTNGRLLLDRGWKVFYSLPPELPYTTEGGTYIAKDWNELGEHVVGWDAVPEIMELGIRRLDLSALFTLQMRAV